MYHRALNKIVSVVTKFYLHRSKMNVNVFFFNHGEPPKKTLFNFSVFSSKPLLMMISRKKGVILKFYFLIY